MTHHVESCGRNSGEPTSNVKGNMWSNNPKNSDYWVQSLGVEVVGLPIPKTGTELEFWLSAPWVHLKSCQDQFLRGKLQKMKPEQQQDRCGLVTKRSYNLWAWWAKKWNDAWMDLHKSWFRQEFVDFRILLAGAFLGFRDLFHVLCSYSGRIWPCSFLTCRRVTNQPSDRDLAWWPLGWENSPSNWGGSPFLSVLEIHF